MSTDTEAAARAACEKLAHDYGRLADAWQAEELAQLFTPDGVFDRLGVCFEGREAIREFIAHRPRDFWQRHHSSDFEFALSDDGRKATGQLKLVLERGKQGQTQIEETLHAQYTDRYVLSTEGWKIERREVRLT